MLFRSPAAAREYAVTVMRIGYQIVLSPPDGAEARPDWSVLSDVWREHVSCCRTRWRAEAE